MPLGNSATDNEDDPTDAFTDAHDWFPQAARELLDADATAVVLFGLDGTVWAANETALELLGADSVACPDARIGQP